MPDETAESPRRNPRLSHEVYRSGTLVSLIRLHWFIRLRWVFVAAAFVVLLVERFLGPPAERPWELWVLVAAVGMLNLVWIFASRTLRPLSLTQLSEQDQAIRAQLFANAQVACDLFLLTMILRFTGGIENPMLVFYIFHIAISALLLKKVQAVLQAIWAVSLYATMVLGEFSGWLTPHYHLLPALSSPMWYANSSYVVVGMLVQACGVFGVLYFTLQITARLNKRDRQLLAAYEALHTSKTAIQDLQARRSRFMQTAAHQLKSPLAVIQTLAGLIRDKYVPDSEITPTTNKIIRRCREGIIQVTELLTLARVEQADPRRHYRSQIDIGPVIQEVYQRFLPIAEEKGITLTLRIPANREFRVHIDPKDASDVFNNLIDNAIKYTPAPGSVLVEVTCVRERKQVPDPTGVSRSDYRDFIYVSVRDTGIGIDADILSTDGERGSVSVFDAFRRGNNALAAGIPGTGLGLSIVREIVEQVGGRINARSSPGEGSTFTIILPAGREQDIDSAIRDTRASRIVIDH
ncbi:MAG: HAMP domain-containing sensor histidine kinase [Planctomycetota bacterium]